MLPPRQRLRTYTFSPRDRAKTHGPPPPKAPIGSEILLLTQVLQRVQGAWPTLHAEFRVGLEHNRDFNSAIYCHLVKQTSHWRNNLMFAYRLSVFGSVAPPGTAWDAEGLRGNVANENKIIVLVRTITGKWQSKPVLHRRPAPEVRGCFRRLRVTLR